MKKQLFLSASAILALSVSSMTFATPQPQICPSVSAIQAVGVSRTVIKLDNRWYAGRRNQMYDTTDAWSFIIGNMNVVTANDAYNAATTALPSLVFRMGPFTGPIGKWVCLYNTDESFPAVAVTTPIAVNDAAVFFQKL